MVLDRTSRVVHCGHAEMTVVCYQEQISCQWLDSVRLLKIVENIMFWLGSMNTFVSIRVDGKNVYGAPRSHSAHSDHVFKFLNSERVSHTNVTIHCSNSYLRNYRSIDVACESIMISRLGPQYGMTRLLLMPRLFSRLPSKPSSV